MIDIEDRNQSQSHLPFGAYVLLLCLYICGTDVKPMQLPNEQI